MKFENKKIGWSREKLDLGPWHSIFWVISTYFSISHFSPFCLFYTNAMPGIGEMGNLWCSKPSISSCSLGACMELAGFSLKELPVTETLHQTAAGVRGWQLGGGCQRPGDQNFMFRNTQQLELSFKLRTDIVINKINEAKEQLSIVIISLLFSQNVWTS